MTTEKDKEYMHRALELASRAAGYTSPNPLVGAVVVKDDVIIGEGWHELCGELHAERNALADVRSRGIDPEGATIYVTLEPCCHYGKTPPCTEAILEAKLARVVYGALDPNPKVAGEGLRILEAAGVKVDGPVLNEECLKINDIFFHYITTGLPYVIMKYAMTADGKIATSTGDSRWVTGPEARSHVHETRRRVSAILAGIGTVLADDPMLNCRLEGLPDHMRDGRVYPKSPDPVRVILDSRLRIPEDSQIVKSAGEIPTLVAYVKNGDAQAPGDRTETATEEKKTRLKAAGVELLEVPADDMGHADISAVIRALGERGLDSVLVEGGGEVHDALMRSGLVNKVQVYLAPKLVGGAHAKTPVGGRGIEKMSEAFMLGRPEVRMFGDDILLEFRVKG